MSKRELLIVGVGLAALLLTAWCTSRLLYPPPVEPTPVATPTPPPPIPEPMPTPPPEEPETPLVRQKVLVCCYGLVGYGAGYEDLMVSKAAAGHFAAHAHDLAGRCPSESDEDAALRRVLQRPAAIGAFGRATVSKADRAAYRERVN